MKLNVIIDKFGNIVGSGQVGKVRTADGQDIELNLLPGAEQTVHQIEVADSVMKRSPEEIHQEIQKLIT
jgi:hypothetical protein